MCIYYKYLYRILFVCITYCAAYSTIFTNIFLSYTTYIHIPTENLPTTGYDSDAEEAADEGRGTGTGNANLPGSGGGGGGEIGGRSNGGADDGSRTTRQVITTL